MKCIREPSRHTLSVRLRRVRKVLFITMVQLLQSIKHRLIKTNIGERQKTIILFTRLLWYHIFKKTTKKKNGHLSSASKVALQLNNTVRHLGRVVPFNFLVSTAPRQRNQHSETHMGITKIFSMPNFYLYQTDQDHIHWVLKRNRRVSLLFDLKA